MNTFPILIKYCALLLLACIFPHRHYAQQNIIDVPSSEIEEKGKLFFQEQISLSNHSLRSGTTFTYGLGKRFELGINFEQVTFNLIPSATWIVLDKNQPEESPDVLVNFQKGVDVKKWFSLSAGTKSGINIPSENYPVRYVTFSYVNSRFTIPDTQNFLIIGSYYSNTPYAGEGTHWGYMIGLQADFIKDKFSIIGEFLSGNNSLNYINSGLQITLPGDWQFAAAATIPPPGSQNDWGTVIQISKK